MKRLAFGAVFALGCSSQTEALYLAQSTSCGPSDASIEAGKPDAEMTDAPNCSDGIRNQDETDVDCGGSVCSARCGTWRGCVVSSDCAADRCALGECNPIDHLVFIIQENQTFDRYFGMYPGVDGLQNAPASIPDPRAPLGSARPYHTTVVAGLGASHERNNSLGCIHGGLMDGFCTEAQRAQAGCCDRLDPACTGTIDVMGYFLRPEIPRYWGYADHYVLHDHMYSGISGASTANHEDWWNGFPALCTAHNNGDSCTLNVSFNGDLTTKILAQTDITYLLHQAGISWKQYGQTTTQGNSWPHCIAANAECPPACQAGVPQGAFTYWLPESYADVVGEDGETAQGHATLDDFFRDLHSGSLPAVSVIIPGQCWSEHQPRSSLLGERYVAGLINGIGHEPDVWNHTAILEFTDDYGGYYDHVNPPTIDGVRYGMRVPSLLISAWAKEGFVDHQQLSFGAHRKLIEDTFLEGARLDPATMGRHDSRPSVPENAAGLGDIRAGFDKTLTAPRAPFFQAQ